MLVYTQISLNKEFRMFYEPIDIRKIVNNIKNIMKSKAKGRKIQLITKYCSGLEDTFCTEPQRLKQVLFNLVGNAIKFTFDGYVKIEVDSIYIKSKKCLKISVKDTGIGMTKKSMSRVFRMFQIIENQKGNKSGTGLGLYISKQIVKRLTIEGNEGLRVES